MDRLTLTRPDDWHLHLRDGAAMAAVLPDSARRFARAIVMPNLKPPVRTTQEALAYRERILAALPEARDFEPLMTLYLTDNTPPEEIARAKRAGRVHAVKFYPGGRHHQLGRRRDAHLALLPRAGGDGGAGPAAAGARRGHRSRSRRVRPREGVHRGGARPAARALRRPARWCSSTSPRARRSQFVEVTGPNVAATITAHHLLLNRNALFQGGIRPHHYCLPVLKREEHREALVEAATSGNPKFFLGTDSAPHARAAKEAACGCAGIYSAHARDRAVRRGLRGGRRARPAGGLRQPLRRRFLRPAAQRRTRITLGREEWTVPADAALRHGRAGAAARRRDDSLEDRLKPHPDLRPAAAVAARLADGAVAGWR